MKCSGEEFNIPGRKQSYGKKERISKMTRSRFRVLGKRTAMFASGDARRRKNTLLPRCSPKAKSKPRQLLRGTKEREGCGKEDNPLILVKTREK